ncbi:MAG: hypothetical protein LBE99_02215 [Puniceicoccales bacterium]|jgi:hypothetical protein|nr:hypothetical protein [Puniceicoccales bacterium]
MSHYNINPFDSNLWGADGEPLTGSNMESSTPSINNDGHPGQNKHPTTSAQSSSSGPNITTPNPIQRTAVVSSSEVTQICQILKKNFTDFAEKVKNLNLFNGAQWGAVGRSFKQLCKTIADGTFDEVKFAAKDLGNEIKALFRQRTTPQNVVENAGNILHRAGEALDHAETLDDIGNAFGHMFQGLGEVVANVAQDAGNTLQHRFNS